MDILVHTEKLTNRVKYAFRLVLETVLGATVTFTDDKAVFLGHSGPKLSYGVNQLADEPLFVPAGLLFRTSFRQLSIEVRKWEDTVAFFHVNDKSSLPFDPFSAAFYMASRYEEFLPHVRDKFDRFDVKNSLAYRNGFLQQAVINRWAEHVRKVLEQHYPDHQFPQKEFRYLATFDVDNAYAYKGKGPFRNLGGFVNDLLSFNFKQVAERARVLLGFSPDPYDTFDYLLAKKEEYGFDSIFFFLLGDYGPYDKNVPVYNHSFRSLIKRVADQSEVGIHPSFGSNGSLTQLQKEVARLSDIVLCEVKRSRQHFLILKLPETYRNLTDIDIVEDYSMGFAGEVGFRAGICEPYPYYDLDREMVTPLTIHPFQCMDGTLREYMELAPKEAIKRTKALIDEVRAVNGCFVSLWHNDTVRDMKDWTGWREVFEETVKYASTKA